MSGNSALIQSRTVEIKKTVHGAHILYWIKQNGKICVGLLSEREGKRFGLPGGKVEQGETLYNALNRELAEEMVDPPSIHPERKFKQSMSEENEFACNYIVEQKYHHELLYVDADQIHQEFCEPYVKRVVLDSGILQPRETGKAFLEGSFNPYGNGQPIDTVSTVLLVLYLASKAYGQPLQWVALYSQPNCYAVNLVINMTNSGHCYTIDFGMFGYQTAQWYPIPFLPASRAFFYNDSTCTTSVFTVDVVDKNCEILNTVRGIGADGAVIHTGAPTPPTLAPTASIQTVEVWPPYQSWCTGDSIVLTYGNCTMTTPTIWVKFSCMFFTQPVLNYYNDSLCTTNVGGGGLVPSLTCQRLVNKNTNEVEAYYKLSNNYVCPSSPTDAPTVSPTSAPTTSAPTSSPPPTTPSPTRAPTPSPPTSAPTTICPAASSVNVVGWEQQAAPLWVSFVDPAQQALPMETCGTPPLTKKASTGMVDVIDAFAELIASYAKKDFAISRKIRNKLVHALNGNSVQPTGKSRFRKRITPKADPAADLARIEAGRKALLEQAAALGVSAEKPPEQAMNKMKLDVNWFRTVIDGRIQKSRTLWYEGKLVVLICPDIGLDVPKPTIFTEEGDEQVALVASPKPAGPDKLGKENGTKTDKKAARQRNKDREDAAIFDQEKWNKGVDRVVATLAQDKLTIYEWWLSHPGSRDFRREVLNRLWGKQWEGLSRMDTNQWLVYCAINNISNTTRFYNVICMFPEWRSIEQEGLDPSAPWFNLFGSTWDQAKDVLSAEQVAVAIVVTPVQINGSNGSATNTDDHDPVVCSQINGNNGSATNTDDHAMKTPLCRTQSDVDEQTATDGVYDAGSFSPGLHYLKGSEMAARLATTPSSRNATQLFTASAALLHADFADPTNIIQENVDLELPSTTLVPRQVRPGVNAALAPIIFRLPYKVLGPVQSMVHPLTDTDLMMTIVSAAISANQNIGRADNTNLNGFLAIDLAWLGRLRAVAGFQMDQCLVKLLLLHKIFAWDTDQRALPMSQVKMIDQYTTPAPVSVIEIGFNDSPIFGEDCGGATSVFPFLGGMAGQVAFHVTVETVPINQRQYALWIPATILLQDTDVDVGLALAMFIMMWAPYPFGIYTTKIDTVDTAGGNPEEQTFVHSANTVMVPGQSTLHIIMPRRTTVRNPTQQAEADNMVVLRPRAGPVAANGIAANALLNVNWVNQPNVQFYNLAEYLYTWAISLNTTHIANFIQRLSYTVGIEESVRRAEDLITMTTEMFPSMAANDGPILAPKFAPNSIQSYSCTNAAVLSFEILEQDLPLVVSGTSDYLLLDSDPLGWNKIATGLASCSTPPDLSYVLPDWIGNVSAAYWEQLMGMAFAIVWNSHYANVGWSAYTWASAFGNNTQPEFRQMVRGYYQVAWKDMIPTNATFGPMMADYFVALTGRRPAFAPSQGGSVTIFDMMSPPTGQRANCFAITAPDTWSLLDGLIPANLADIWIQYFANILPRWQSSIPMPSGPDSWKGYHKGMNAMNVSNLLKGGWIDAEYDRQTLDGNETADYSDDMRWNERMMYLSARATSSRRNGGLIGNTLAAGAIMQQRPTTRAWYQNFTVVPAVLRGNTMLYPCVESDGELIFAVTLTQQGANARAAMFRRSQLPWYAWQLAGMIAWNDEVTQADTKSASKWDKRKKQQGKASTSSTAPEHGGEDES